MAKGIQSLLDPDGGANDVFSSVNVISIVGETESFIDWVKKHHPDQIDDAVDGYIFFLQASVNGLIFSLLMDTTLGIEEDQDLRRAMLGVK